MTCFGVLLGGVILKSAVFQAGGAVDLVLTIALFGVIMVAFGVFAWMIVLEFRRAFAAAAIRKEAIRAQRSRAESAASRAAFRLRNRVSLAMGHVRTALFGDEVAVCETCDAALEAVARCAECNVNVCTHCRADHLRLRAYKSHTLLAVANARRGSTTTTASLPVTVEVRVDSVAQKLASYVSKSGSPSQ